MITIAEVIEQCAQIIDQQDVDPSFKHRMSSHIRALAAQYEGCIVAEGENDAWLMTDATKAGRVTFVRPSDEHRRLFAQINPLYRAKESK
jgi:hypothetical protein